MVYLYLNCEGWQRHGPFKWLRFRDDRRVIEDDEGNVVASFDGECWRTAGKHASVAWRDPMITSLDRHPHPREGRF